MIKDDGMEITEGSLPIKLESETQEDWRKAVFPILIEVEKSKIPTLENCRWTTEEDEVGTKYWRFEMLDAAL
jgi:hypothetical protein